MLNKPMYTDQQRSTEGIPSRKGPRRREMVAADRESGAYYYPS